MGNRRNWFVAILFILISVVSVEAATVSGGGGINAKDESNPLGTAHTIDCLNDGVTCSLSNGELSLTVSQASVPEPNYYVAGSMGIAELMNTDATCRYDGCLTFDGVDDYILVTDYAGFETAGDLSIAAWIYPTVEQTGQIVSKGAGNAQWRFRVDVGTIDGVLVLGFVGNGAAIVKQSTASIPLHKWSHVVVTLKELGGGSVDRIRMYINGEMVLEDTAVNWGMPADASALRIGANDGFGEYFAGRMDTVVMFNAELPPWRIAEMAHNYGYQDPCSASTADGYGNLINCWKLDDASGSTATAIAGASFSAQNGTLTNFPATHTGQSGWARDYRKDIFVTCKFGGCLGFDGTNDYVNISDHADLKPTDASFAAWVYPTKDQNGRLFSKGGGTEYKFSTVSDTANDNKVKISFNDVTSSGSINVYEWSHIVVTADNNITPLTNSTFESCTAPATAPSGWTRSNTQVYCNNAVPYAGTWHLTIEAQNQYLYQTRSVTSGKTYRATAWIAAGGAGPGVGAVRVSTAAGTGGTERCSASRNISGYGQVSCTFVASATETVYINLIKTDANADWVHFDNALFEGDDVTFYINGVLDSVQTGAYSGLSTGALQLGGDSTAGVYFAGKMDEVCLYSGILSQGNITSLQTDTCNNVGSGLNGRWVMDAENGTSVADSAGTAQNGTLTNSALYKPNSGWNKCALGSINCLHLDGNDDHLEVSWAMPELHPVNAWTIEGWVYLENTGIQQGLVESYGGLTNGYAVRINSSNQLEGWVFGNTYHSCQGGSIAVGTWTHFAVTFSSTADRIRCYVNASLVNENTSATTTPAATTAVLRIGAETNKHRNLGGRIQDVRIWNIERDVTDISNKKDVTCDIAWTNLTACWKLTEVRRLQSQLVPPASIGNDSNDCITVNTPCRTLSGLLAKVPKLFRGNTVIHIASGVLDTPTHIRGAHAVGEYYYRIRGYINKTANSFSDSPSYTGTSAAVATSNYPANTRSVFFGAAGANFKYEDLEFGLLKITGGTGWVNDTGTFNQANWHRIECPFNTTVGACTGLSNNLSVVTEWVSVNGTQLTAVPSTNTEYAVYNEKFMSTIDSGIWMSPNRGPGGGGFVTSAATYALKLEDSSGVSVQKLHLKGAKDENLDIRTTSVDEIAVVSTTKSGYRGVFGNVTARVNNFWKNNMSWNMGEGYSSLANSYTYNMYGNVFGYSWQLSGAQPIWGSIQYIAGVNLFKGNAFGGYDVEVNGQTGFFGKNRMAYNSMGVISNVNTNVWMTDVNYFVGNRDGIIAQTNGVVGPMLGVQTTDQHFYNNKTGTTARAGGYCTRCTGFTYGGNYKNVINEGLIISANIDTTTMEGMGNYISSLGFFLDQSKNRVGSSANDCALVARLQNGVEVEVSILVTDGVCPQ